MKTNRPQLVRRHDCGRIVLLPVILGCGDPPQAEREWNAVLFCVGCLLLKDSVHLAGAQQDRNGELLPVEVWGSRGLDRFKPVTY